MKPDASDRPPALAEAKEPRAPGQRIPPKLESSGDQNLSVAVEHEDQLRDLFGVKTRKAAGGIMLSALNALGVNGAACRELMAAIAVEMEPRDAVEAMLFSQQVATHAAMTALSRKVLDATNPQLREGYERSMTRLSRTFLAQMDALKRYRVARELFGVWRQAAIGDV